MSKKVAAFEQFQIRLPPGMREHIKAAADANGRSMNAEIIATLSEMYSSQEHTVDHKRGESINMYFDDFKKTLDTISETAEKIRLKLDNNRE